MNYIVEWRHIDGWVESEEVRTRAEADTIAARHDGAIVLEVDDMDEPRWDQ